MRIDFEELRLYTGIDHMKFDEYVQDSYLKNTAYFDDINNDPWFYKSSPYYLFEIARTRDSGLYEILYDYIKRRVDRGKSVFDFGAGIGTLEVMLLKRYPASLTIEEMNLLCIDFVFWRMRRRNAELSAPIPHYDYVVSMDTLQRLSPETVEKTVNWLLSIGDRCFFYVPQDSRGPFCNEVQFDLEGYITSRAKEVNCFHGLWDVKMI
jgi:hypothetical protein